MAIHFIAIVQVRNYELFLCFWYKWSLTKLQYKWSIWFNWTGENFKNCWSWPLSLLYLLSPTILICYDTCHERCVMRKCHNCHYCHQNVIITIQGQKLIASHYWQLLSCCPALSPCLIIFLWWSPRWSNYGFNVIAFQNSLLSKKQSNKFW